MVITVFSTLGGAADDNCQSMVYFQTNKGHKLKTKHSDKSVKLL